MDLTENLRTLLSYYNSESNGSQFINHVRPDSTIQNIIIELSEDIQFLLNEVEKSERKREILEFRENLEVFPLYEYDLGILSEEVRKVTETLTQEMCKCRHMNVALNEKCEDLKKGMISHADILFQQSENILYNMHISNASNMHTKKKCVLEMSKLVKKIKNCKEKMRYFWNESHLIGIKNIVTSIERDLRHYKGKSLIEEKPRRRKMKHNNFLERVFQLKFIVKKKKQSSNVLLREQLLLCIAEVTELIKQRKKLRDELQKAKYLCTTLQHNEDKFQSSLRKFTMEREELCRKRELLEQTLVIEYKEEVAKNKCQNSELQAALEETHNRLTRSSEKIGELEIKILELHERLRVADDIAFIDKVDLHPELNDSGKNYDEAENKLKALRAELISSKKDLDQSKLVNSVLEIKNKEQEQLVSKYKTEINRLQIINSALKAELSADLVNQNKNGGRITDFIAENSKKVKENGQIHQDMICEKQNNNAINIRYREQNRCKQECQELKPAQILTEPGCRYENLRKRHKIVYHKLRKYKDRCDLLTKKLMTSSKEISRNNVEGPTVTDNQALNQRERMLAEQHMNNRHPSVTDRQPFIPRERKLEDVPMTKRDPSVTDNQLLIQNKGMLAEEHKNKRDPSVTDKEPFILKRERKFAEEHMTERVPSDTYTQPFIQRESRLAEEHMKKLKQSLESTPLKQAGGKSSRKEPKEVVRRPRWK